MFPRIGNLTPRSRGIKTMRASLALEVFNSCVEKFVEKTDWNHVQRDKHGAWFCLHQDDAISNTISVEKVLYRLHELKIAEAIRRCHGHFGETELKTAENPSFNTTSAGAPVRC
jgi:hypothetical protein